tara:strand:+ start:27143 stop:27568 length:426 start_codon:yes stop_codon:yes gene_type:complete
MPRPAKPFAVIFDEVKTRIAENTLTLEELSNETGMDQDLLSILLDQNNDVVDGISRLFSFMKINLHSNPLKFSIYKIMNGDTQVKILRTIKPKASIYYDKPTGKFFKFVLNKKRNKVTDHHKSLIMSEMQSFLEKHKNNLR